MFFRAKRKKKRSARPRGRGCLRLLVLFCVFLTTTCLLCSIAQHVFYAPYAQRGMYKLQRHMRTSTPEPKDSDYIAFDCGKHTYTVKPDGSALRQIHEGYARDLVWSPDGAWLAMTASNLGAWRGTELFNVRFDGSDARRLTFNYERESALRWSRDGESLDFLSGKLSMYRVSAKGEALQRTGELDRFAYLYRRIAWSPDGRYFTRLLQAHPSKSVSTLLITAQAEKDQTWEHSVPGWVQGIHWAPDSKRIALGAKELHIYNVETRSLDHLIELGVSRISWSPNGRWIAFTSQMGRSSEYRLHIMETETGKIGKIIEGAKFRTSWSPDSEWIALKLVQAGYYHQLFKIRRDGGDLQQLTDLDCRVDDFSWSPR